MNPLRIRRVAVTLAFLLSAAGWAKAQGTEVVSRNDVTSLPGDAMSYDSDISADGRYVVFASDATNLVSNDTNGRRDIFIHDREGAGASATIRLLPTSGFQPTGNSLDPAISPNGRFVAFQSVASDWVTGDANGFSDIFLYDRDADGNGTFDEAAGTSVKIMSNAFNGAGSNNASFDADVSDDGHVVFTSRASNLVTNDNNFAEDVFIRRNFPTVQTAVCISNCANPTPLGPNQSARITADGVYVVFESSAGNLVAGDTGGTPDIFLYEDLGGGSLIQVNLTPSGNEPNDSSFAPAITPYYQPNEIVITFSSRATDIVPGAGGTEQVFIATFSPGGGRNFSVASVDSNGILGNGASAKARLTSDGRFVSFESVATNLVAGDTNALRDTFLHDRVTGETRRASVGTAGTESDGASNAGSLSDDLTISFSSTAANLDPIDTSSIADIYTREIPMLEFVGVPQVGQDVHFVIRNGRPDDTAWVLLSSSGYGPSALPAGAGDIYINFDSLTTLGLNFSGLLSATFDDQGIAQTATIPFPNLASGLQVYAAAYTTTGSTPPQIVATTPPITFTTL